MPHFRQQVYPQVCRRWNEVSQKVKWTCYSCNLEELPAPSSLSLHRVAVWFKLHGQHLQELTIAPEDTWENWDMTSQWKYFTERMEFVTTVLTALAPVPALATVSVT